MCLRTYSHIYIGLLALFCFGVATSTSARAASKEQVLYSFQGIPDGSIPVSGVVLDASGNLYGATTDGGSSSCGGIAQCGTVYELQPPSQQGGTWTESVLYIFQGRANKDGETPAGGVIFDKTGKLLYGTTAYGGVGACPAGCGTVYEMTPPPAPGGRWTESVIYSFEGGSDGYVPMGNLIFDAAGNLYGATYYGGGFGVCDQGIYPYCGTVFELSPPKTKGGAWTEKVLYSFKSGTDGADPNGSLVFDTNGALYGTTYFGGNQGCKEDAGVGCGTVFKLSPPAKEGHAWGYEILHRFREKGDGTNPAAGVILDKTSKIYGTTLGGGSRTGEGTVFTLTPPTKRGGSWVETLLHVFALAHDDGWFPLGLVLDAKGNLYGLTASGGEYGGGMIFRLRWQSNGSKAWVYSNLYGFAGTPDGEEPDGYPTIGDSGNIYGVTLLGGTGPCYPDACGTVFEFAP
jgi:uncharacterized repeat protein (TIGR03803 family)